MIVRLSSLGDVILATSAVGLLHARRPDLAIDFLTRPTYAPLLAHLPGLRRVFSAPEAGDYSEVLDLQGGAKGQRGCRAQAPGARRLSYPRARFKRRLLVLCGPRLGGVPALVSRFSRPIAGRLIAAEDLIPNISPPSELRAQLRVELERGTVPERGWVVLAPGASKRMKAIPDALVSAMERAMHARGWGTIRLIPPGGPAGWIGGGGLERGYCGALPTIAALLSEASGLISSDSGILHLGTAVGVPAVGLFGPTSPALGFSPLGRSCPYGVDLPCRPCHVHGPRRCWLGHTRCWREMDPRAVVGVLDSLANSGRHHGDT